MFQRLPRTHATALIAQLTMIVGGLVILVAAPPATGRMMLVPMSTESARSMIALAVDGGAALVGPGPLPGSFVIDGQRANLIGVLLHHGVALVAAPTAGCGR